MQHENHPDSNELDDWAFSGPRNPLIATLVSRLAVQHGLRVREIEAIIITALVQRMN